MCQLLEQVIEHVGVMETETENMETLTNTATSPSISRQLNSSEQLNESLGTSNH